MINIYIEPPFENIVDPILIEHAVNTTLIQQNITTPIEVTVVIDGDEKLKSLNQEFLGINSSTDVLSFPAGGEIDPETGEQYLGDIIISYPRAKAQAGELNNSVEDEIKLLVVHGVLHLLGFDHVDVEEKQVMWDTQKIVLDLLGCKITRLPE